MDRYAGSIHLLGPDVFSRIRTAKVLVVGAGGIGCELLKTLVLTGFENIETIDLDTIDVSNLNRQFLFRTHHVSMSKAKVAAESAMAFNPRAIVIPHHGNIFDKQYGLPFFKKFDIVFSALDNQEARRFVNRMCLAGNLPLLEAGTTGYLGQSQPIIKGVSACYECFPKPPQQNYPVCTIRNTPSLPVHCVVWAKELHKLLFGVREESALFEETIRIAGNSKTDDEATEESDAKNEEVEKSVYMARVLELPTALHKDQDERRKQVESYAYDVASLIFHDEIVKRLSFSPDIYKTSKHQPVPIGLKKALQGEAELSNLYGESACLPAKPKDVALKEQVPLSVKESMELLLKSIEGYYLNESLAPSIGTLDFDKDRDLDLYFVTAATNLRAATFNIPLQSQWDVKSIAGSIIPAIATTNAMVAGLQVFEAIKILCGKDMKTYGRSSWINRQPMGNRKKILIAANLLEDPVPTCLACSKEGASVYIDTKVTTLREFLTNVVNGALGFTAPCIDNGEGFLFEEERDEDEDDEEYEQKLSFLPIPMSKLVGGGLRDGTVVQIIDFSQDLKKDLSIIHRDKSEFDEEKHPKFFELLIDSKKAKPEPAVTVGEKRPRKEEVEDTNNLQNDTKKVRVDVDEPAEILEGAIEVDDNVISID